MDVVESSGGDAETVTDMYEELMRTQRSHHPDTGLWLLLALLLPLRYIDTRLLFFLGSTIISVFERVRKDAEIILLDLQAGERRKSPSWSFRERLIHYMLISSRRNLEIFAQTKPP